MNKSNAPGNSIFTPFQLTPMPETGFREHLNHLCSIRSLQVVHHRNYTLFVDKSLNIQAAIAAAGIYESGIQSSEGIQRPKYFISTGQFSCATPDLLRSRIFLQLHALKAIGKFKKITSGMAARIKRLYQSVRIKRSARHPEAHHHTCATQWHTVRLTA